VCKNTGLGKTIHNVLVTNAERMVFPEVEVRSLEYRIWVAFMSVGRCWSSLCLWFDVVADVENVIVKSSVVEIPWREVECARTLDLQFGNHMVLYRGGDVLT
jgi:hypothetical protein